MTATDVTTVTLHPDARPALINEFRLVLYVVCSSVTKGKKKVEENT